MLWDMFYTWNTSYTQGNWTGKEIHLHVKRKRKVPEGPAVEAELRGLGMKQQWLINQQQHATRYFGNKSGKD